MLFYFRLLLDLGYTLVLGLFVLIYYLIWLWVCLFVVFGGWALLLYLRVAFGV